MKVSVVREGGIAGLARTISVDDASLSKTDAAKLRSLIDEAGFFALPERLGSGTAHPDAFEYEVTAEDGDRRHTVRANEAALPAGVRSLIAWLESLPGRSDRYGSPSEDKPAT